MNNFYWPLINIFLAYHFTVDLQVLFSGYFITNLFCLTFYSIILLLLHMCCSFRVYFHIICYADPTLFERTKKENLLKVYQFSNIYTKWLFLLDIENVHSTCAQSNTQFLLEIRDSLS